MLARRMARGRRLRSFPGAVSVAVAVSLTVAAAPAEPRSVFTATPLSRPSYDVAGPHPRTVLAEDGTRLHVDLWVPEATADAHPPKRLPAILVQTPYAAAASRLHEMFARHFARHGYVVAIGNVRGTGRSGGCLDQFGAIEVSDTLRVVEHLATAEAWSSNRVGMFGLSYEAFTALGAATSDDRERSRYVKAIVPAAGGISLYDAMHLDGVPKWDAHRTYPNHASLNAGPGASGAGDWQVPVARSGCVGHVLSAAEPSGDYTPFYRDRDARPRLDRLRAATLLAHGLGDRWVWPHVLGGFADRIPSDTPHRIVIGQWDHVATFFYPAPDPDSSTAASNGVPEGQWRSDWFTMVRAWFDRYLMDLPTGVEAWPPVQVQGLNADGHDGIYGRWREEAAWPSTGGPVGHLALGADGTLGVPQPSGQTAYRELPVGTATVPLPTGGNTSAVFATGPLPGPLHLTGQPSLQLWARFEQPDAHVTAVLEAFDEDGRRIAVARDPIGSDTVFGARSARHLDPLVDGGFRQAEGRDAPVGVPVSVQIRLKPLDLLVPAGGTVRLTVAGNFAYAGLPWDETIGSGSAGTVTILHDCVHTSVLRFLMPRPDARWLDVPGSPTSGVAQPPTVDGGGLATAPVCGQPPARDEVIGPSRP